MPSLKRGFHQKIKEAVERESLKTHDPDNLSIFSTGLVPQEEVAFD
jgi:hypothetical protein